MSLLDVAPIIEQMLLVSENVSDLNFSCGQKPQVEINGVLYPASPIGLGRLSAFQTEMIAMSLMRDNPDASMIPFKRSRSLGNASMNTRSISRLTSRSSRAFCG